MLKTLFLALRPWSFTASVVPIIITAATTNSILSYELIWALSMALFIHSGANLTNTYFDYKLGVDTIVYNHDNTLVDKKLQPKTLFIVSVICYFLGTLSVIPAIRSSSSLLQHYDSDIENSSSMLTLVIFLIGLTLAIGYTAGPFGLKYYALGDITIFLCFGPLLMECACLILTDNLSFSLLIYSIPIGFLTEAILHTNNSRDIKNDRLAGITTLATIIDFEYSFYFFVALITATYLSIAVIAYFEHCACMLTFITLPLAFQIMKKFYNQQMQQLTEDTAKLHLLFGVLMFIGIISSTVGFQTLVQ